MCIDVPFAMASMKVALATMLSHTHIDLDPAQAYEQDMFFGVIPPKNLKATFSTKTQ
jgi:cytochrome P450